MFIESINTFLIYLSNVHLHLHPAKTWPQGFHKWRRGLNQGTDRRRAHSLLSFAKNTHHSHCFCLQRASYRSIPSWLTLIPHFTPTPFRYHMAPDEVKISFWGHLPLSNDPDTPRSLPSLPHAFSSPKSWHLARKYQQSPYKLKQWGDFFKDLWVLN